MHTVVCILVVGQGRPDMVEPAGRLVGRAGCCSEPFVRSDLSAGDPAGQGPGGSTAAAGLHSEVRKQLANVQVGRRAAQCKSAQHLQERVNLYLDTGAMFTVAAVPTLSDTVTGPGVASDLNPVLVTGVVNLRMLRWPMDPI
eukprot:763768-Hanusia_phi.AAC.1